MPILEKAKKLTLRWSKKEDDLVVSWPDYTSNGSYLLDLFPKEVLAEFEKRQYNTKTLKFSIERY